MLISPLRSQRRKISATPLARCGERVAALGLLAAASLAAAPAIAAEKLDASVYDRAALFMPENEERLAPNADVRPHWRPGPKERFTYRKELGDGAAAFIEVDAATGAKSPAFDAKNVAAGLSAAGGKPIDPLKLPFRDYDEAGPAQIEVNVGGKSYLCATDKASCALSPAQKTPLEVASPDGRWLAFLKDENLWVKSADGKESFALTTDGARHFSYGGTTEVVPSNVMLRLNGLPVPPVFLWSPDSKHILALRIDERKVREITIVRSTPLDGSVRPQPFSFPYAEPGDPELPMGEEFIFDVDARTGVKATVAPVPQLYASTHEGHEAWWSPDGSKVYLFARPRFMKSMSLYEIDPKTGAARTVITETGKTFVESGSIGQRPMVYPLKSGEVIWFSERDGAGRLYLYDGRTGALKRALTTGPGVVSSVLRVDEPRGVIYVQMCDREPGSDPYYHKVYKIRLADGRTTLLTPEDADHEVFSLQQSGMNPPGTTQETAWQREDFSPSGRYFVDNVSRADLPTKTLLRRVDGSLVAEIEHADVSRLEALGVTPPERFSALAADGKTKLYGVILRPTHFDPSKRYAVIDSPYPGPQSNRVHPRNLDLVFDRSMGQSFSELGFVVVIVDGRGTPGRTKTFHDESYGGLGQAGHLDDHVAVLKELGARYPYMDLDRIGIYGGSGGGYATANALFRYPDTFKVGVSDAGNHDQRGYITTWGENYNGPEKGDSYASAANKTFAAGLKGKLFLMHGDMDINVFPDLTLQLVDALIKANKDFDLLIVPNAGHTAMLNSLYARRRAWDYMVTNLMGAEPPHEYDLSKGVPKP
jgi:dipeptidyl aminopeptidase/acylaminoacyl peptidase